MGASAGRMRFREASGPDARNRRTAFGTVPARLREAVSADVVAGSLYEQCAALGTERVLVEPNPAGQVAGVDETQPGVLPDTRGAQQRRRGRVTVAGHLVVRMEGGDVPWDLR